MASLKFYGRFNMDALNLHDAFGADIATATATALTLRIGPGTITSFPDFSPSVLAGSVYVNGEGFTYDAGRQINGGTVTSLDYFFGVADGTLTHRIELRLDQINVPATQLYSWFSTGSTQVALATILSGNDSLHSPFRDDFSSEANLLRGYGGDDYIRGAYGPDTIYGGDGADTILGGGYTPDSRNFVTDTAGNVLRGDAGADSVLGDKYFDDIDGGLGDDTLAGGAGGDLFRASAGTDRILDFKASEGDQIRLTPGVTYTLSQNGADTLVTLSNGSTITLSNVAMGAVPNAAISAIATGNPGDQPPPGGDPGAARHLTWATITPDAALSINHKDFLYIGGGAGNQATVLYGDSTISVTFAAKTVVFGLGIIEVSSGIGMLAANQSRLFIGGNLNDRFYGGGGDGAFGGAGNDTLQGGGGNNLLQGNQGSDSLIGSSGADTVYGGQDDDRLILGQGNNFGQGNKGNDSIFAGDGVDTLLGGQDNDSVVGGGGNDFINGNLGNDSISAGGGNDTIYGEAGNDTLQGDEGADLFRITGGTGLDRITDFYRIQGDRIVLDQGTTYSTAQVGTDTVVTLAGGDQVVLVGVQLSTLNGDWISN